MTDMIPMKATPTMLVLAATLVSSHVLVAQDAAPQRPNPARLPRTVSPEWIKEYDKDGDGKLSDAERQAMQAKRKARQQEVLAKYDKDGDGKLSDAERQVMAKEHPVVDSEMHKAMIAKYDADGDGQLNAEEARKARTDQQQQQWLKRYDLDGDGKLSDQERAAIPRSEARPPQRPAVVRPATRPKPVERPHQGDAATVE